MSIQNIIRGAPLFNDLYDDEIDTVLKECHVMQLEPGERIFEEGDPGEDIYIILRGKVNIVKGDILIAELQKADLFGEMIIVYEGTRSTAAVADAHTDLLILNYSSVMKMYDKNPRAMSIMMLNLARLLAERLKKSNNTVRQLKTELYKKEINHY